MNDLIENRRTFAIISHPDAGKTTLTEKFLLYGGAIQKAGQVKAKGEARRSRSDFMTLEKEQQHAPHHQERHVRELAREA